MLVGGLKVTMKLTPAMRQFMETKEEYPDAILLFRMGDFYECFYDDAIEVSQILGITLTSRGKDETKTPLAGIPYHSLDKYLKQLVDSGKKIAICEQLEDPKKAKGVVKRGVVRVVTPGTVVEESVLHDKSNNYLVSLFIDGSQFGFACCDISTGEFLTAEFDSVKDVLSELARFSPREILVPTNFAQEDIIRYAKRQHIVVHKIQSYYYFLPKSEKIVCAQFQSESIAQLGLSQMELALCASGSLLQYITQTQKKELSYIHTLTKFSKSRYMQLPLTTIQNLELLHTISQRTKQRTLLSVIDKTKTSMGSRLLKNWLLRPLLQREDIMKRYVAVESFCENQIVLEELQGYLKEISDIERLVSRISYGQANGRDINTLKQTLSLLAPICSVIDPILSDSPLLQELVSFPQIQHIIDDIDKGLKDECPVSIREGGFIKKGYHAQLDELWDLKENATTILAKIEQDEIQKTGIPTLKIKYNRVFGYFLEVTNRFKDKIPNHYIRKQSTVNSERFITEELKELEQKILFAQDKIHQLEYTLFQQITEKILSQTKVLHEIAQKIAQLDCLSSFSLTSIEQNYVQPQIHDGFEIHITQSRHPVVESTESQFIANDCTLTDSERMMIITGPNMAGKSTYMRQIALITILAQIGCFVPAKSARIGIVDTIFTRVGSYDDVSQGQSTFMVEMSETAYILQQATPQSLIIFDEIGSGTSTYDGVAIAWAVALDLAKRIKAKTLFATHYHVLTKLEEEQGVVNYNVAVVEKDEHITFLRKIVRGKTDKSYGIFVAKLAGVPQQVVENAKKIQLQLENEDILQKHVVVEKRVHVDSANEERISYAKLKQKTLDELE